MKDYALFIMYLFLPILQALKESKNEGKGTHFVVNDWFFFIINWIFCYTSYIFKVDLSNFEIAIKLERKNWRIFNKTKFGFSVFSVRFSVLTQNTGYLSFNKSLNNSDRKREKRFIQILNSRMKKFYRNEKTIGKAINLPKN